MTVRFVQCEFCQTIGDFQVMHLCPRCRKVICRRCKGAPPLQKDQCAKAKPCEPMPPTRQ